MFGGRQDQEEKTRKQVEEELREGRKMETNEYGKMGRARKQEELRESREKGRQTEILI